MTDRISPLCPGPHGVTRAALALGLLLAGAPASVAQQPAQPPAPTNTFSLRNWTRVEMWSFFEPAAGVSDPDYAHVANRLRVGFERRARRYDIAAALQYVQFGGLPTDAVGPGPLGTGALYYTHGGSRHSRQVYLKYLNVRLKNPVAGLSLQAGRMGYASGAEAPSGHQTIEAVKRQRVDARLIGEFEWSQYQRSYDGLRVDFDRPAWHASAAAMRPTQGGFEEVAGTRINGIDLLAGTLSLRPGRPLPGADVQLFASRYNDTRAVRARPDNTGRSASNVDVGIGTIGATLTGVYATPAGELDLLLWVGGQTGHWYEQRHRAWAFAAEAGHQWSKAPWRPWIRGAVNQASGDNRGNDGRHATFFPMLPTGRRYSQSSTYSLMNLRDVFGQVSLRPDARLSLRADLHRLALVSGQDLWYSGSGATQASGTIFGYAGRPANGATALGTIVEGSADYTIRPHWSINGYVGFMKGGSVVRRSFAGGRLVFAYLESLVQF